MPSAARAARSLKTTRAAIRPSESEGVGGEGGIRTHVPVTRQDAFEASPLRPLRYLSARRCPPVLRLMGRGGPLIIAGPTQACLRGEFALRPQFDGVAKRRAGLESNRNTNVRRNVRRVYIRSDPTQSAGTEAARRTRSREV